MGKIVAAIISALLQLIQPTPPSDAQLSAQTAAVLPIEVYQHSNGVPHLVSNEDIQALVDQYSTVVPTPSDEIVYDEYKNVLHDVRKDLRNDIKFIAKEKREERILPTGEPIPVPSITWQITRIPAPTELPKPSVTIEPKPTITIQPKPTITLVPYPTVISHPTKCPLPAEYLDQSHKWPHIPLCPDIPPSQF